MAYRVSARNHQTIILKDLDESGETRVTVKPASGNDELQVQQLCANVVYTYEIDGVATRESRQTTEYIINAARVWVSLEECNIETEDSAPLFTKEMKWGEFLEAWSKVGREARKNITKAMWEVNPHWGN